MSQMQTTTVDKEGRVKIPKILLEKMGLEAPATLAVGLEGGMVVMMPHPAKSLHDIDSSENLSKKRQSPTGWQISETMQADRA